MTRFVSKLLPTSLFAVIFLVRWSTLDSPLPQSWTAESRVGFTAVILEKPDYTDSKTIIKKDLWTIKIKGYVPLELGKTYKFIGKVTPQVLLTKLIKIEMVDPTFEEVEIAQGSKLRITEWLLMQIGRWRERMTEILAKSLPEPHASLSAGILLGVKGDIPYSFYQSLIKTGTMHVVAASGFNVTIVATVIMGVLSMLLKRNYAIIAGILGIVIYVIMSGASAAVVRAGIMAVLTLVAYYLGRASDAKRLLWITGGIMLLLNPLLILDIGFELSMVATWGMLYLEPKIRGLLKLTGFFKEYLSPTLAATIATLPVTMLWFGRASILGPVVNMIILPLVPIIMLLTAVTIGVGFIYSPVAYLTSWLVYVPLQIMISVIEWF